MRVTFSMTYQKMLQNLNRKQAETNSLSAQVASGKRMAAPKDDPLAWSQSMDIKQNLRELATFEKNVDFATGWNQATTTALNQLSDLLIQARQVGLAAMSGESEEKKAAQVSTLDQVSSQALGLANSQYDSLYIFSGKSYSAPAFDSTTLDYQGDTEDFQVRMGKSNTQTINLNGESVFLTDNSDPSTNILKRIEALKTAIQNGDQAEIQTQTAALETAQEHVSAKNSLVGARMSGFDTQKTLLSNLELNDQTELSDVEDADILNAITQLQQKQTALEAALQVTAMIDDLTLVRFL